MKDLSRNAEQVSGISSGDLAVDRSYLTILWDLARGTTRDFGCRGVFVACPVSVGGLVIVSAVVELEVLSSAVAVRFEFSLGTRFTTVDVKDLGVFGCRSCFVATPISAGGMAILCT